MFVYAKQSAADRVTPRSGYLFPKPLTEMGRINTIKEREREKPWKDENNKNHVTRALRHPEAPYERDGSTHWLPRKIFLRRPAFCLQLRQLFVPLPWLSITFRPLNSGTVKLHKHVVFMLSSSQSSDRRVKPSSLLIGCVIERSLIKELSALEFLYISSFTCLPDALRKFYFLLFFLEF